MPNTKSSRSPFEEFFINLKVIIKNIKINPIIENNLLEEKLSDNDAPQSTKDIFTKIPKKYKIF